MNKIHAITPSGEVGVGECECCLQIKQLRLVYAGDTPFVVCDRCALAQVAA